MSIILDGTAGITSPGGDTATVSVATPILKSPSSLSLQTNGSTTAVTIDASQNVGVGVTTIGTSASRRIVQIANSTNGGAVLLGNDATTSTNNARVIGASGTDLLIAGGGASGIVAAYTNDTERMRITSTGVVGIGNTSPPAWTSPFTAVSMNTQGSLMATAGSMQMGNNIYYDGSYKFIGTGYANRYYQNGGDHTWTASSASGSAGGAVTENTLLTLNSSACLILKGGTGTASVGIAFPATQVASSDANTLDDYEEGTWTPSYSASNGVAFSSVTYSEQGGYYTKIGNIVFVQGRLRTSSLTVGGASGELFVNNLPFTCVNNSTEGRNAGNLYAVNGFSGNNPDAINAESGNVYCQLGYRTTANGAMSNMQVSMLQAASGAYNQIFFSVAYRVA